MRVRVFKTKRGWRVCRNNEIVGVFQHVVISCPSFHPDVGYIEGDLESVFVLGNGWKPLYYDGSTFRTIRRRRVTRATHVAFLGTNVYVANGGNDGTAHSI